MSQQYDVKALNFEKTIKNTNSNIIFSKNSPISKIN